MSMMGMKAQAVMACADADGMIDPEDVIEAAWDEDSVLHNDFEWVDTEAAHLYRIEQAKRLIRTVKVPVRYVPQVICAVAYIKTPNSGSAYTETVRIAKRGTEAKATMKDELTRIRNGLLRASALALQFDLMGEFEVELDEIVEEIKDRIR